MKYSEKLLITLIFLGLFFGSCFDFFDIAWGTGVWLGEFAMTWAFFFVAFCITCFALFAALVRLIWKNTIFTQVVNKIIAIRYRLGWKKWLLVAVIYIIPLWFLRFSLFGIVFHGLFFRLSIWTLQLFFMAVLITHEDNDLLTWKVFLGSLLITASSFSVLASLNYVTGYPFSIGWSEGNRLWDYSILFGRDRYDYPHDKEIFVFLEIGRQIVGGLPFLLPSLTIKMARLWIGLTTIVPYLLLGFASVRSLTREKYLWLSTIFWTYLFLKQGPIHPPLILCAVLVAVAWRSKLWFSIPLVALATYFAYVSRYTWTFAPGIWFFMLELIDGLGSDGKVYFTSRIRTLSKLLIFSLAAGVVLVGVGVFFKSDWIIGAYDLISGSNISPQYVLEKIQQQQLLWYRLFPNETYGNGILIGLVVAISPVAVVLLYLLNSRRRTINFFQKCVVALPLIVFLLVGLIVSVKIGGGGDLHNMDMFLITLFFLVMVALHQEGVRDWIRNSQHEFFGIKLAIILLIAVPAVGPLKELRSYDYPDASSWLMALRDARTFRALGMYPSRDLVDMSLETIQDEVDQAKMTGDVLFMDQRQLLTFGFIQNAPLVPEYDKKVLIEQALTSNYEFFQGFYNDLENKRFSLIITQPLNTPQKGSDSQFGEENDAWVKWITNPLLCFYKAEQTLVDVNVQLLTPKRGTVDCVKALP